jgi:hypothetical protein
MLLAFLLSDSGGPAAIDIHDVPIFPAAVIPEIYGVPAVVGHPACRLHCFCSIPAFAGVPLVPDVLTVAGLPAVFWRPSCCVYILYSETY